MKMRAYVSCGSTRGSLVEHGNRFARLSRDAPRRDRSARANENSLKIGDYKTSLASDTDTMARESAAIRPPTERHLANIEVAGRLIDREQLARANHASIPILLRAC